LAYHPAVDAAGFLSRTVLFSGIRPADLEPLAAQAQRRTFPKAAFIFHEGDPGDTLFLVRSGQVKISRIGPGGDEIVLALILPGDSFGELSLFDPDSRRTAEAAALELCECLTLRREPFLAFVEAHPPIMSHLLRIMSTYIRQIDEAYAEAAFVDIPGRVASKLLELAKSHGEPTADGVRIRTQLSQRTLASMVAASRENVNRSLRRFASQGAIRIESGSITVLRPADLRKRI